MLHSHGLEQCTFSGHINWTTWYFLCHLLWVCPSGIWTIFLMKWHMGCFSSLSLHNSPRTRSHRHVGFACHRRALSDIFGKTYNVFFCSPMECQPCSRKVSKTSTTNSGFLGFYQLGTCSFTFHLFSRSVHFFFERTEISNINKG
ncbi:hypothetical protein KP509_08G064200 [Ceratopteris richardii]|uniref:Uncharacterized protein n=1 Tax=Ceratopteris richardii TaxID=49495 RepID=A0A8T2U7E8_CERRI|nr:hypothetical protein KP509_08G064200 [Ceratopteris richardii]